MQRFTHVYLQIYICRCVCVCVCVQMPCVVFNEGLDVSFLSQSWCRCSEEQQPDTDEDWVDMRQGGKRLCTLSVDKIGTVCVHWCVSHFFDCFCMFMFSVWLHTRTCECVHSSSAVYNLPITNGCRAAFWLAAHEANGSQWAWGMKANDQCRERSKICLLNRAPEKSCRKHIPIR